MWEKKDESGGIHDRFNSYTWCKDDSPADGNCDTAGLPMAGTISTTFLATLNGGGGFAGHTDWRIPNLKELISIVNVSVSGPALSPAFHQAATCIGCTDVTAPTCSCAGNSYHWSATSAYDGLAAWSVSGFDGDTFLGDKTVPGVVRAVRGGL